MHSVHTPIGAVILAHADDKLSASQSGIECACHGKYMAYCGFVPCFYCTVYPGLTCIGEVFACFTCHEDVADSMECVGLQITDNA